MLHERRHWTHSVIHETLVDLLTIQKEIHPGILAVMDGTFAGDGPGPRCMTPHVKNVILASTDQVAIDAIAAKMMGFDPMSIGYIRLAHDEGLGVGRPQEIQVVGEDISGLNFGFRVGNNMASHVGNLLWFGPFRRLQGLFFRTPLVYLFILGSSLYHDHVWWPRVGKARMEEIMATEWGRLFSSYPMD